MPPFLNKNQIVSRIAPTPSGFLHRGNVFNILLTYLVTRANNGTLWLRIDDIDTTRSRKEYVEDIFQTLDWLGIEPDQGPSGVEDFYLHHSQQHKTAVYGQALSALLDGSRAYACRCSRKQINAMSVSGLYPGTCRSDGRASYTEPYAIRAALDNKAKDISIRSATGEAQEVNLLQAMGDFVLWRKDGLPAYQLASLCDDETSGTNLIVRGNDLLLSSAAQIWLSETLGYDSFGRASFIHHELLLDDNEQKLSKSKGSVSVRNMRENSPDSKALLREFSQWAGLSEARVNDIDDLLKIYLEEGCKLKLS